MAERHDVPDPTTASDELPPGGFDGLELDSLSDGVRATRARWAAIDAAASRRHHRRPWMVSAAAVVVLIVAVTGLVIARSGPRRVAVGDGAPAGAAIDDLPVHLIPTYPYDIQSVAVQSNGATMSYEADGAIVTFGQYSVHRTDSGGPRTAAELAALANQEGAGLVDAGRQGLVWVWCEERTPVVDDNGDAADPGTAADARWIADDVSYVISADYGSAGCDEAARRITDRAAALRDVSASEWATFLTNHSADTVPPGPLATIAPTTTTVPEDPPADRATAEDQIRAAVADWNQTATDGSFPNLEAGTEKAAEYAELFDTAARQSGAAQSGDRSGNTTSVTTIRFATPERAAITMSLTAVLPSGTYTFPQDGEAILRDGRWVVTYRTVVTTLRRACTPPGGYADCPSTSGSDNGTVQVVPAN